MNHRSFLLVLTLITFFTISNGQVSIEGPVCVIPDQEYQYNIFLEDKKEKAVEICVEGGIITSSNSACYNGMPVSYIRVTWSAGVRNTGISLTTAKGKKSIKVNVTTSLLPGAIDTVFQLTKKAEFARGKVINCSAAKGGNCDPKYEYQWEVSTDNNFWEEIKGQNDRDLSLERSIRGNYFVRRKVLEKKGQTIGYSNVCLVIVNQDEKSQ